MNKLKLDFKIGKILLNDRELNFQTEQDFLSCVNSYHFMDVNGFHKYSVDVAFLNKYFAMQLTYHEYNLYDNLWFLLKDGEVMKKGYDCTETDMKKDVENVNRSIKNILMEKEVDYSFYEGVFYLGWGSIHCFAQLRSPMVTLTIKPQ